MNAHTKPRLARKVATLIALLGVLVMSSGFALMGGAGAASAADTACTPSDAWTETTGWVDGSPGPGWYQVDEMTTPATAPVYGPGQRYAWNPHGPQDETDGPPDGSTPLTDPTHWQANTSNYNGSDPLGVVFQQGGGNNGNNASWFYWTKVEVSPGTPAVTTYKFAFDHPAVTCEVEATMSVDPPTCENSGVGSWSLTGEHMTFSPAASGTGGPGSLVVEATADAGYLFDNGLTTKSYTVELPTYTAPDGFEIDPESGACVAVEGPQQVTPGPVTFSEDCDPFAVNLPGGTVVTEAGTSEIGGVEYAVTGDLAAGGTVTVKATPTGELVFGEGAQAEWTHTFATEEECTQVEPPVVDPPTDETTDDTTDDTTAGTTTSGGTTPSGTQAGGAEGTVTVPEAVHAGLGSASGEAPAGHGLALVVAGAILLLAGGVAFAKQGNGSVHG